MIKDLISREYLDFLPEPFGVVFEGPPFRGYGANSQIYVSFSGEKLPFAYRECSFDIRFNKYSEVWRPVNPEHEETLKRVLEKVSHDYWKHRTSRIKDEKEKLQEALKYYGWA